MASNIIKSGLALALYERKLQNNPIRLGLVGCGEMGTDLMCRVALMDGIEICHIVTRNLEKCFLAAELAYNDRDKLVEAENINKVYNIIEANKIAIGSDIDLLLQNDMLDIVIEATGHPNVGAQIGYKTLQSGKNLVMMNVEADVTIGAYLNYFAKQQGLIYSLGAGDEPTACMELINFITSLGHEIIMTGKGKNNPLIPDATPDDYIEEAKNRNMNPRMLVEFIDGSKTMVEMACIANATGLKVDVPGMHGANAALNDLEKVFIPKQDGGILNQTGVVDYSIGADIAPGVFAISKIEHPRLRERMQDLKLGPGPYYKFYRPYHLTAMEVPLTCARIMEYKIADMQPLPQMSAEVCGLAKKDLNIGDKLDFIGLYTYRAFTLDKKQAKRIQAVPCGLLEGARITHPVKKGELLTYNNCTINKDLFIVKLRETQDRLLNNNA